ncbi:NAD(P)/FAD-dependent oxidoreductase [Aliikangiella sp. IMCC44359]|uniref:NAD(P)/FAD-dependent oxidoreductase n=1 Tax=Aliikangiella sp. IMCC44359 TaxID=3459125 RepID=UPI00403AA11E
MTELQKEKTDVLVIGAGPSGSLAASLLQKQGVDVRIVEKQVFPRFSIGESLLPQLMCFLKEGDMLETVDSAGYQFKNGAAFSKNGQYSAFNFEEKFSNGPGTTYQVKRAEFDHRLALKAEELGVPIAYQQEVTDIKLGDTSNLVTIKKEDGTSYVIEAGFVLDASGFGRVLPKLLDLELPSEMPVRQSIFCHIKDNIRQDSYDRNKILISVHPKDNSVWYWLIPFSDGTCSLGVVAKTDFFDSIQGSDLQKLEKCIAEEPDLSSLLENSEFNSPVQSITGYSANVKSLFGKNYALLGNAGEFLDPVFSSGVTIAFKSATLASSLIIKQNNGESVSWEEQYAKPLLKGVDTFRVFVNAWYDGRLQDIIFYKEASDDVRRMICSILAGYAWDETNPYVAQAKRRLNVLAEICRS